MNKTASVLALAGTIALLGAGAAQAAPITNYTTAPVGTVSDPAAAPGETVVFSGPAGYFTPGELLNITVDRTAGTPAAAGFGAGGAASARGGLIVLNAIVLTDTTKADANGGFSYSVKLTEEGTYTLSAAAADGTPAAPITATVVVDTANAAGGTVAGGTTGGTTSASNGLANTGIDSAMLLWGAAGIGALGLGAGSIVVARRRSAEA
ncbi:LPXTG cell wall anchor domain-containing protein [Arthrobacter agilis]|uniref:LPXTG cell wall anchor domain-containing protein n=1 Tax=Arthrobacter agilis TaxID=37921 RepID=UPI0027821B11|nr:LPXTG cell wall anchor domain-containing protein [Arthrobacter agilis]MDQ0734039.1 LPXTG-motif cell wall-anchored protein [Arthrobacter agilis]